jgi:hypothetical protein
MELRARSAVEIRPKGRMDKTPEQSRRPSRPDENPTSHPDRSERMIGPAASPYRVQFRAAASLAERTNLSKRTDPLKCG